MPKFRIEVRDRAIIDIMAEIEVEAESAQAAIEKLDNADWGDPQYELDFEPEKGLGWCDRYMEPEYKVYDEGGALVHRERTY